MLLCLIFAAKAEQPAVFIKLHKVGSTTVSSFLACHGNHDAECCSCLRKEHVLCDGAGPWSHDVAIKYPYLQRSSVLAGCSCSPVRLVVLRHPVDRFISMVGFFFRRPFMRGGLDDTRLAAQFVMRPGTVTEDVAIEMLDVFQQYFPSRVKSQHKFFGDLLEPIRVDEYTTTFASWHGEIIGITERMRVSLALFAAVLGWDAKALCVPVETLRKRQRPANATHSSAVRAALARGLQHELAFYDNALQLHEAQVQQHKPRIDELLAEADAQKGACFATRIALIRDKPQLFVDVQSNPVFVMERLHKLCGAMTWHANTTANETEWIAALNQARKRYWQATPRHNSRKSPPLIPNSTTPRPHRNKDKSPPAPRGERRRPPPRAATLNVTRRRGRRRPPPPQGGGA